MSQKHIHYLVDAQAQRAAVQISMPLWEVVEKYVLRAETNLRGAGATPFDRAEPLAAFAEFKTLWDFRYPYEARVQCRACGTSTDDWEQDPAHPFHLTNTNFGGLLVFRCKACNATVRKKHFRDHVAFECTPVKV